MHVTDYESRPYDDDGDHGRGDYDRGVNRENVRKNLTQGR